MNFPITAVFATGARDGTIMIWDTRASYNGQPKPDNVIMNAHKLKQQNMLHSTTALIFQDDENLISCSAGDGYMNFNTSIHLLTFLFFFVSFT